MKTIFTILYLIVCVSNGFCSDGKQTKKNSLSPAPKGSFSIVVMSDTQGYLGRGTKRQPNSNDEVTNPIFESQTRWIVENKKRQSIVFVSHAGDIVDKNNREQWVKAREYMDYLHGNVPYGMSVGNHDMNPDGNSSLYQEFFSASRYKNFDWYGGHFIGNKESPDISGNNSNSYQLFSAEGIDFIIIHLECNAPDNVLTWTDNLLEKYKDRFAIVTTHMFLGPRERPITSDDYYNLPKGIMTWSKCHGPNGNSAQQMWDKCLSKHTNLHIIIGGDQSRSNALYTRFYGNNGNTVHAILNDYSASPNGAIRIFRFLPTQNEIQVITYDTVDKTILYKTNIVTKPEEHNFKIPVSLSSNKDKI